MNKILLILLTLTCAVFTSSAWADNDNDHGNPLNRHNEATVAELQQDMAHGRLTSVQLTLEYIARIIALDQHGPGARGPGVNSVIELNPDALKLAAQADSDRRHGHV